MVRTTVTLPEEVLRRAKVKSALTDQTVSEIITTALEKELAGVRLPSIAEDNDAWMALAETSFDFWDNEADSIYDAL